MLPSLSLLSFTKQNSFRLPQVRRTCRIYYGDMVDQTGNVITLRRTLVSKMYMYALYPRLVNPLHTLYLSTVRHRTLECLPDYSQSATQCTHDGKHAVLYISFVLFSDCVCRGSHSFSDAYTGTTVINVHNVIFRHDVLVVMSNRHPVIEFGSHG
jgi:hypothetical protein